MGGPWKVPGPMSPTTPSLQHHSTEKSTAQPPFLSGLSDISPLAEECFLCTALYCKRFFLQSKLSDQKAPIYNLLRAAPCCPTASRGAPPACRVPRGVVCKTARLSFMPPPPHNASNTETNGDCKQTLCRLLLAKKARQQWVAAPTLGRQRCLGFLVLPLGQVCQDHPRATHFAPEPHTRQQQSNGWTEK